MSIFVLRPVESLHARLAALLRRRATYGDIGDMVCFSYL
jgi:hypothetical protein